MHAEVSDLQILAARTIEVTLNNVVRLVELLIYLPEGTFEDGYFVRISIDDPLEKPRSIDIRGADKLQALRRAFKAIDMEMEDIFHEEPDQVVFRGLVCTVDD